MKYVAVDINGVVNIHIPHFDGIYMTICGLDGNDDSEFVGQTTVDVPKGAKIDCEDCLLIWQYVKRYKKHDFAQ